MGRGRRTRLTRPAPAVSQIAHKYTACEIHEVGEVYPVAGIPPRTWWQVTAVGNQPLEAEHRPSTREGAIIWARQWLLGLTGGAIEVFDLGGELLDRLEVGPWEKHPRYAEGVQLELG